MAAAAGFNSAPGERKHRLEEGEALRKARRRDSDDEEFPTELKGMNEMFDMLNAMPPETALQVLEENLAKLRQSEEGELNRLAQLVTLVKRTHDIKQDNYLPWDRRFCSGGTGHVDGIKAKDLAGRAIVWTITPDQRFAIAFQYIVSSMQEGNPPRRLRESLSVFQRHPNQGIVYPGGHNKSLKLDDILSNFDKGFKQLTTLLEGGALNTSREIFIKNKEDNTFKKGILYSEFHIPNREEMLQFEASDHR
jgi:hypothetical protein